MSGRTVEEIEALLAEPFPPERIRWKPQLVKGDQAMMVAYVDPRDVMDKLDFIVGPSGWQDSYDSVPGSKIVRCRLSIKFGAEWITKEGVGGETGQPDEDDRVKAAYSGALKIAAVKFGIGREVYRIKQQWVGFDAQRKRATGTPAVVYQPGYGPAVVQPRRERDQPRQEAQAAPQAAPQEASPQPSVWHRVVQADALWTSKGWVKAGELITYVRDEFDGAEDWQVYERAADRVQALVMAMGAEVKAAHEKAVAEGRA
jgi:hypothetical protein